MDLPSQEIPFLESYLHHGDSPIPTLIAQALCDSPSLATILFPCFGSESLPALVSFKSLRMIEICCRRSQVHEVDMLPHAPINVARHRRSLLAVDTGPTIDENVESIVSDLATLLFSSTSTIPKLFLDDWEGGDWLEKLYREFDRRGEPDPQFTRLTKAHLGSTDIQENRKEEWAISTSAFTRFLRSTPALEELFLMHPDGSTPRGPTVPLLKLKKL